jgi:hypothetical protein
MKVVMKRTLSKRLLRLFHCARGESDPSSEHKLCSRYTVIEDRKTNKEIPLTECIFHRQIVFQTIAAATPEMNRFE